ncbi:hypothetical protein Q1695_014809 [Nippostrongylus brasiliensis]|nr:hypothetical protein Q1695_014809 [Nippostrongylus brasiliensis]
MATQVNDSHDSDVSLLTIFSKFNSDTTDSVILDKARELCAEYLGGVWGQIDSTQLKLKRMSGGLTNLVFSCELPANVRPIASEPRIVLLRIQTQSDSLQLTREVAIMMNLNAHGFGPKLLAIFPGGRIEEFIPSRNLTKEESLDKNFIRNIAKLTAEINDVDMPLPKSPQFVTLVRSWLTKCRKLGFKSLPMERTCVHEEFPAVVTIDDLEKELDEIDAFMKAQKGPSVFCHNDIVPSNVLVKTGVDGEEESFDYDRLVIIDFEFAIYNLRGMEIGNAMAEFGMKYGLEKPPHYDTDLTMMTEDELSTTYCEAYLDQLYKDHDTPEKRKQNLLTGDRQKDLEMLRSEGRRFLALPHFFWGIWNIICMEELEGSFEFGYVPHAKDRLIMYYRFKENMYKY